jgi:hypothetical protein
VEIATPGSSSWMPYASQGVKGLDDDDDGDGDGDDDDDDDDDEIHISSCIVFINRNGNERKPLCAR